MVVPPEQGRPRLEPTDPEERVLKYGMPPRKPVETAVRAGELRDLPSIVEVYNHYVQNSPCTFEVEPVRPEDRRSWFEAHRGPGPHRLLVAEERPAGVVGWATTSSFRPRAAYSTTVEASVYVAEAARGKAIGQRLYEALFSAVQHEDLERIVAGVTLPNPASERLHVRFGFRHVGTFTRVGRKFGRYWDVAWFERPLKWPGDARPRAPGPSSPNGPGAPETP